MKPLIFCLMSIDAEDVMTLDVVITIHAQINIESAKETLVDIDHVNRKVIKVEWPLEMKFG